MTDESGRFVDDQQAGVFVEDVEQVFQTRGILTTKHTKHTKEDLNRNAWTQGGEMTKDQTKPLCGMTNS